MTWAWVLVWLGVGVAAVVAFGFGVSRDGRATELETRWYAVRFATSVWTGVAAAAGLLLVVLAYTGSGALTLIAWAAGAARSAADAGVARTCEASIPDEEG